MSAAIALPRPTSSVPVAEWRAGIEYLRPHAIPCPGVSLVHWPKVHDGMLAFLDIWGEAAVDLGWSGIELFGVHRGVGMLRVDSTGLLTMGFPVSVAAMDASEMHFTNGLVGRHMTNPSESIPIWKFRQFRRP